MAVHSVSGMKKRAAGRWAAGRSMRSRLRLRRSGGGGVNKGPGFPEVFRQPW